MEIVNKNELGSFDLLALELIRQIRKQRFVIYMFTVYADESTDAKSERIFAVAGVMGTQEEWDELEIKWVARTGGKIFHATDCESGYGAYKNIPIEKCHKEYETLTNIIVNSRLISFASILNIADHNKVFRKDLKEGPYYHCFLSVVIKFIKLARISLPPQVVKFVFDINHKMEYNAAYLYENYLFKQPEYKEYAQYMGKELAFATSEKIGIQVADLISHEAMKHWDNIYFTHNKRHTRKSIEELFNSNRFMWNYYGRDYFNMMDKKLQQSSWQEDYKKWLSKYRRQDNAENRTKYLIYLDSQKD
jgi:hypothetical protein